MDDAPVFPFSKLSKIQDKLLYVYFSVRSNYKSFLGCYCKGFEMNHWTLISATMVKWYTMVFPWYCQNSKSVNVNRLFLSKTLVWPKENMWCLLTLPQRDQGQKLQKSNWSETYFIPVYSSNGVQRTKSFWGTFYPWQRMKNRRFPFQGSKDITKVVMRMTSPLQIALKL